MKYVELSRSSEVKNFDKTMARYKWWAGVIILGLAVIGTVLTARQKLQNDQIEFTQPVGSFVFEGELTTLPTFGQTFVPRQAGLRGIYIPIRVVESDSQDAALTLHLRTAPEASTDIRTVTLPLAELAGQNLAHFSFEPLPDSFNTRYYFLLEPVPGEGKARIELRYAGPAAYGDGALYRDGQLQDFQANFFLAYDRSLILLDWGRWLLQHAALLLVIVLLILLPGAALLVWLLPLAHARLFDETVSFNQIEWTALASGFSIAIYPILFLLANLIGIRLGPGTIFAFLTLSGILLIIGIFYRWPTKFGGFWGNFRHNRALSGWTSVREYGGFKELLAPASLLFWLIFFLSAAVRIIVVRGLDVPLWQDSYHHTMISQLLIDHGGLFDSWAPYAPLESFSYHFGFHAFVAAYNWLTGSNVFQAVIASGQVMNLLAVPGAYLLGRRLGGSDWAGTFAALITGLLSDYPMSYVDWGRYTQLTGQAILPAIMILTWLISKNPQDDYKLMGLTCLGIAGLALAHYRILFFYPCFVAPLLWLEWFQANWRLDKLRQQIIRLVIIAFGAAVTLSPWLWRVIASQLWQVNMFIATAGTSNEFFSALTTTYPSVFDYVSPSIVLLGLAGLIWGSWQQQAGIFVTGGWGLMLLILANPHFLKLPGTGIITYFTVLIAAYLPFSILAGFTLAKIAVWLVDFHRIIGWGIVLGSLVVGLIGAQERAVSFKPANAMVTKPDLAAMAWIRENIPPDATFWANSRLAYGNYTFVGTDAGLWIPFLTGRHGMVLPIIYGTELIDPPDYSLKILDFYRQVHRSELASFDSWQTLKQAGITHVYIGQRRGEVWRETGQPIDPLALQNSPHYQNVYHQDQVWIFALK